MDVEELYVILSYTNAPPPYSGEILTGENRRNGKTPRWGGGTHLTAGWAQFSICCSVSVVSVLFEPLLPLVVGEDPGGVHPSHVALLNISNNTL